MFFSNILKFSKKSLQFSSKKNSQVFQAILVSNAPHLARVKTGVLQANASTGAIPKSSFETNINPFACFNNLTSLFQVLYQTKLIFFEVTILLYSFS
jgi:hypothetical protein